jgi:hypothetical protein
VTRARGRLAGRRLSPRVEAQPLVQEPHRAIRILPAHDPRRVAAPSPTTTTSASSRVTLTRPMVASSATASSSPVVSSTVSEIDTSDVVTRSTTMRCRRKISKTRARKP